MKKTILVLASSPINCRPLALGQEIEHIRKGLQRSEHGKSFCLEQRGAPTITNVDRAMRDVKPEIVHFCGHGAGRRGIVMVNDRQQSKRVGARALAEFLGLFAGQGLECVILNACSSEIQAKAIARHIDYVVGFSGAIEDRFAVSFTRAFYEALGAGDGYETAVKRARAVLGMEGLTEGLLPTLITRRKASRGGDSDVSQGDQDPLKRLKKACGERNVLLLVGGRSTAVANAAALDSDELLKKRVTRLLKGLQQFGAPGTGAGVTVDDLWHYVCSILTQRVPYIQPKWLVECKDAVVPSVEVSDKERPHVRFQVLLVKAGLISWRLFGECLSQAKTGILAPEDARGEYLLGQSSEDGSPRSSDRPNGSVVSAYRDVLLALHAAAEALCEERVAGECCARYDAPSKNRTNHQCCLMDCDEVKKTIEFILWDSFGDDPSVANWLAAHPAPDDSLVRKRPHRETSNVVNVSIRDVAWYGRILWHTLRVGTAMYPDIDDIAFHLSLCCQPSEPQPVPRLGQVVSMMEGEGDIIKCLYRQLSQPERVRRLGDIPISEFHRALVRLLRQGRVDGQEKDGPASSERGECRKSPSFATASSSHAARPWCVVLSTLDRELERALEKAGSGYALVFPVRATAIEGGGDSTSTETNDAWVFALKNDRGEEESRVLVRPGTPDMADAVAAAYNGSPVLIKRFGSPFEDVEREITVDGVKYRLEHRLPFSEYDLVDGLLREEGAFAPELREVLCGAKTWLFIGYRRESLAGYLSFREVQKTAEGERDMLYMCDKSPVRSDAERRLVNGTLKRLKVSEINKSLEELVRTLAFKGAM